MQFSQTTSAAVCLWRPACDMLRLIEPQLYSMLMTSATCSNTCQTIACTSSCLLSSTLLHFLLTSTACPTLPMLQVELEAARRGGTSSPSRSIASSLAESDCIPAFNPPSGAMPPSGAHRRPGMPLLNLQGGKGLSGSPAASPASASKVLLSSCTVMPISLLL